MRGWNWGLLAGLAFGAACWEGFGLVPLKSGPKWRRAVEPTAKSNGVKVGA